MSWRIAWRGLQQRLAFPKTRFLPASNLPSVYQPDWVGSPSEPQHTLSLAWPGRTIIGIPVPIRGVLVSHTRRSQ